MLRPVWYDTFNANWQVLKAVRFKVQATNDQRLMQLYLHLLQEAETINSDLINDYSIPSADVQEWQDNVANLAHRIGMAVPIEDIQGSNTYQDTLDRTAGVYQTVRDTAANTLPAGGSPIGLPFDLSSIEHVALLIGLGIAGLIVLPHVLGTMDRRRS